MLRRVRHALGSLAGSLLGVAIIGACGLLPVCLVLWIASALGVPWAITVQVRVLVAVAAALDLANALLPAWMWFALITLLWLAFLDVFVRGLVRDEFSKQLKSFRERKLP